MYISTYVHVCVDRSIMWCQISNTIHRVNILCEIVYLHLHILLNPRDLPWQPIVFAHVLLFMQSTHAEHHANAFKCRPMYSYSIKILSADDATDKHHVAVVESTMHGLEYRYGPCMPSTDMGDNMDGPIAIIFGYCYTNFAVVIIPAFESGCPGSSLEWMPACACILYTRLEHGTRLIWVFIFLWYSMNIWITIRLNIKTKAQYEAMWVEWN